MKSVQQGFTLIELMIVVAIVGILAAVAVPQYTQYTDRAKMTEALVFAGAVKNSISEYYITQAVLPDTSTRAGIVAGQSSVVVRSVAWSGNSLGIVVRSGQLSSIAAHASFKMTPAGSASGIVWTCITQDLPGSVLPANCR